MSERSTRNESFTLFTESPTFNLETGSEDKTKTTMMQWEPPCSLDDVRLAIEELNADSPASIMMETETESLSILGGPLRFMCAMSDGSHVRFYLSRAKEVDTNSELEIRMGGTFQKRPGRYALSKSEVLSLAIDFISTRGLAAQRAFDVEIQDID